jgi:hypothetical protein
MKLRDKLSVVVLALFCLAVHWRGFTAWFRADDFAWMGVTLGVHNFADLLKALFSPLAEGTIRPLSERAFFMAGYALFGLHALPFRMVIFATQFANLALVASIGDRLTGVRGAGFLAALFWTVNNSAGTALGWASAYNQVLCAFFLLLAFHFLLRYIETGAARYNVYQWLAFLAGFGAMEVNIVYPALAAVYTLLCARRFFTRTLPLFAVSVVYSAVHHAVSTPDQNPEYALHFTGSMVPTLARYWAWTVGPLYFWTPVHAPAWLVMAGVALVSLGLVAFAARRRVAWFALAWFAIAIAPVLPLRDHITDYYAFVPAIGLCWLGGWAVAQTFRSVRPARYAALALAAVYLLMAMPRTLAASDWNYRISMRARDLVEGLATVGQLHPGKTVLLEGVDTELFWNAVLDHPHRLIPIDRLYLTPGSQRRIQAYPDLGDVDEFVLPPDLTSEALDRDEVVVYDVRGPKLRNITSAYAERPLDLRLPASLDVANPLAAALLGPEWYAPDGNHRWMPKRATLRMAGPSAAGQKLYLRGSCPEEQLRNGPLAVTVSIDGVALPAEAIRAGENSFELAYELPASATGQAVMQVAVEVERTFHTKIDQRDLGLAFGVFEIR